MDSVSERKIYLDNSSTTAVCDQAIDKIVEIMKRNYGNPSSLHSMGISAECEIDNARNIISKKINCLQEEIYFTSGGTESNNLAILGTAEIKKKVGRKLITTSVEHPSVLETFKALKKFGFETVFIDPDPNGSVPYDKIFNAMDNDTILVSMMLVNNETGSIFPVEMLKKIIDVKKSRAVIHVDAVQAFCKIPIDVKKFKIDLMSMSSHKIHGPKGVGALYISKTVRISPLFFGGGQQNKIRPGTESCELIAGFAKATELDSSYDYVCELRDYCTKKLLEIPNVVINSSPKALPYILNFSFDGIRSETLLHYLASKNIFVSSGSACAKGKRSYVLEKLNLPRERIYSAIRVSFSRYNTKDDVDLLIESLKCAEKELVKRRN